MLCLQQRSLLHDGQQICQEVLLPAKIVRMLIQIMVNDQPAEYFEKNNIATLIYKHDENIYLLSAQLLKDELVKIAESMK